MFQGFWSTLPRPIIGLSPMDGVTDQPYRHITKKYGRPDVVITEFTAASGLARNAIKLLRDFVYDESQRPIVAQIFGNEPETFYVTAIMVCALGFDGLDINMGCPAKNVSHSGSGAALILTPKLAQELITSAKKGIEDWYNGYDLAKLPVKQSMLAEIIRLHEALPPQYQERRMIPVSVKTRIGYDVPVIEEWIPALLEMEPAVITLHGRTLKQMYSGEANWEEIAKAAALVHQTKTLILGNGDIHDPQTFFERVKASDVDGALIGRATEGNPWILSQMVAARNGEPLPPLPEKSEVLDVVMEHCQVFENGESDHGFMPMRKHLAWYIKGFPNASDFRTSLVLSNSSEEVSKILEPLKATLSSDN
jgi:tRNA-dihydrouridine synthase B